MLPLQCVLCKGDSVQGALCPPCRQDIQRLRLISPCKRCGLRQTQPQCDNCARAPSPLDALAVKYEYAPPLDALVHQYKYAQRWQLASALAQLLPPPPPAQLIIPVPLHAARQRWRGFNQAYELAKKAKLAVTDGLLRRVVDTVPQAQMPDKTARVKNIRGAFYADTAVRGHSVLLVDDVMSSGATLFEAARALKKAGAKSVSALLLARALI